MASLKGGNATDAGPNSYGLGEVFAVPFSSDIRRQQGFMAVAATRYLAGAVRGTALVLSIDRACDSEFVAGMGLTAWFLRVMVVSQIWGAIADVSGWRRR